MSTFREEDQVPDVMQAGAVDWLLKNVSADDLAHTIRQAYAR
jgi:DNA-binding NarL/FixJ family response regulator